MEKSNDLHSQNPGSRVSPSITILVAQLAYEIDDTFRLFGFCHIAPVGELQPE